MTGDKRYNVRPRVGTIKKVSYDGIGMSSNRVRPEYPRPQLRREEWLNLNGKWEFEVDGEKSGRARGLPSTESLDDSNTVLFPPESTLSGVGNRDFMPAGWYCRMVNLPASYFEGHVLLHFGAVDYEAEVWIDGKPVGTHRSGYTPFTFDITEVDSPGETVVTVCAEDDTRSEVQPSGKQCTEYRSTTFSYTRTTGIWQTI